MNVDVRNVLIVKSAWSGLYESAWNRALGELGTDSRIFDTHARCCKGIWGRIQQRILWGPDVARANRDLIRTVEQSKPDVTLLYQGNHYWAETVRRRLRAHTFVVGYHNDDPLGPRKRMLRYRHFKGALPYYDGYHVYRQCNVDDLMQAGVANVAVLMSYYVPWLDYPRTLSANDRQRFGCDLAFAGHWEDDGRVACLTAAADRGIRVRVYGPERYWTPAIPRRLRQDVGLRPLAHGEEYRKALCGATIAACFLSKWNRDQYTRRAFEIPACGAFLLAERTPVMQQLYEEGKQAEFFTSAEEFASKALFYRNNPAARKRIAAAGYRRATTSGYDVHARMRRWLTDVRRWIGRTAPSTTRRSRAQCRQA